MIMKRNQLFELFFIVYNLNFRGQGIKEENLRIYMSNAE